MIDRNKREFFVNYLQKLIEGKVCNEDWKNFIIEHYQDEKLEEVRGKIVQLRIEAGYPKMFPVNNEQIEQLRKFAEELKN